MQTLEEVKTWRRGMKVVDANGEKVGTLDDVFLDRHTGEPEWATVKTGLFGLKVSFVPIDEAEVTDEEMRIPFTKEQIKEAPRADPNRELSPEDERRLWGTTAARATTSGTPRTAPPTSTCPRSARCSSSPPGTTTGNRRRCRRSSACGCGAWSWSLRPPRRPGPSHSAQLSWRSTSSSHSRWAKRLVSSKLEATDRRRTSLGAAGGWQADGRTRTDRSGDPEPTPA